MLVLSRRESEKVNFPTLGISVEVTRVKGKTVRLGIDAPRDVRIVRGEVSEEADSSAFAKQPKTTDPTQPRSAATRSNVDEIQKCLEAATLAIHLAQNQLRQELTARAEDGLEHALACLQELEFALIPDESTPGGELLSTPNPAKELAAVHERKSGYQVRKTKTRYSAEKLPVEIQSFIAGLPIELLAGS